ncbi:MAG: peptidylprolyl isomerase [Phycisphaerales bacterium]
MPANHRPRPLTRPGRSASILLYTVLTIAAASCASTPVAETRSNTAETRPSRQIVALIDGEPITREELRTDLYERAGAGALTDRALDHAIEQEASRRGLSITTGDVQREEQFLLDAINGIDDRTPRDRLLDTIRYNRGLGPQRLDRLLRRNAMLRAMIGDRGVPEDDELELARRIAFGPRYRVRLFVAPDAQSAARLRATLEAAPAESRRWVFADAASERSLHPSSARGGLITDLSPDDPAYPSAITDAVQSVEIGGVSGVWGTDAGHALVLVEAHIPPSTPTDEQIREIREELTLRKQRLEMERLAGELLAETGVVVMDRSLNWSWTNRR